MWFGRPFLPSVILACVACGADSPIQDFRPSGAPAQPSAEPDGSMPPLGPPPSWPQIRAPLAAPLASFPRWTRKRRVYIDAGHGAPGNSGGSSAFCEAEEAFTLAVAEDLARRLAATQKLEVRVSREGEARPRYQARVREAQSWGADVFLSIHEDMRGWAAYWEPDPGKRCLREDVSPGFAVLWSDSGDGEAAASRHGLALRISERMQEAGFLAYDGWDYEGLYEADGAEPGVFVDRHEPGGRIYVLRRPAMPSVIIETHNGLDVDEVARWKEERTLEAFGASVAAALADFFSSPTSARAQPPLAKRAR